MKIVFWHCHIPLVSSVICLNCVIDLIIYVNLELSTRVPDNVRATLNHCFNITTNIPADDENSVEPADDIDSLYNQVKKFHDEATLERSVGNVSPAQI